MPKVERGGWMWALMRGLKRAEAGLMRVFSDYGGLLLGVSK